MRKRGRSWAIVLAAGDGTRLRSLTTDANGVNTPKQYCSLQGSGTLLDEAIRRAGRVVPRHRIVTVVAEQHRKWWERGLSILSLYPENVIVQPRNRGTAVGVLLPLLSILNRDPDASVVVLPSDHFVEHEAVLRRSLKRALTELQDGNEEVILLGITPDDAEPDYGWILPKSGGGSTLPVASFVEKPDAVTALDLMRGGGAWNSFIFAASGRSLAGLYERRLPWLLWAFRIALEETGRAQERALTALYESIQSADFSRDVLQGSEDVLRLLPVPSCGWTDLGTPARVTQCLSRIPVRGLPGRALSLASSGSAMSI